MTDNLIKLAQSFLNELASEDFKDALAMLQTFTEGLEVKNDPDHVEIFLVENIYNFMEKFKVMENNIRQYVIETNNKTNSTNKLAFLYETDELDD